MSDLDIPKETIITNHLFNLIKVGKLTDVKTFILSYSHNLNNIFLTNNLNNLQWTALTLAISLENDQISLYLLDLLSENGDQVTTDLKNAFLNSGIVPAASKNNLHILIKLIRMGSFVNHLDLFSGTTALIISSFNGYVDIIEYLIDKSADLDLQDRNGRTAVMMAANGNKFDIVLLLIRKGANVFLEDNDEKKAKDLTKDKEIIELISLSNEIFMQHRLQDSVLKGKIEEREKLSIGSGLDEVLFEEWFDINLCSESIFEYYHMEYISIYGSLKEVVYTIDPSSLSPSLRDRKIFELNKSNLKHHQFTLQDKLDLLDRCEKLKEKITISIGNSVDKSKFKTIENFDFSYGKIESIAKNLRELINHCG